MSQIEIAYLGGGCFWCLEAVFQRVKGVLEITSGYSGGNKDNPKYEEVSAQQTNHAEVVKIVFDPSLIKFEEILDIFFEIHDPTTLNMQGSDIGTQYRSIILVTSDEQLNSSLKKIKELDSSGKYNSPIVTQVVKFNKFFPAENYHQNFYNNNPNYPYCRIVIDPKIKKLIDIQNK